MRARTRPAADARPLKLGRPLSKGTDWLIRIAVEDGIAVARPVKGKENETRALVATLNAGFHVSQLGREFLVSPSQGARYLASVERRYENSLSIVTQRE